MNQMAKEPLTLSGDPEDYRIIPTGLSGRRDPEISPLDPWLTSIKGRLLRRGERKLTSLSALAWLAGQLKSYEHLHLIEKGFQYSITNLTLKTGLVTCTYKSDPFEGHLSHWQGSVLFYPDVYPDTDMKPKEALNPGRVLTVWPSVKNSQQGRGVLQAGEINGILVEFSSWISSPKDLSHIKFTISKARYSPPFEAKIVWDRRKKQPGWLIYKPDQDGKYGFSRPDEEKERLTLEVVEGQVQVTTTSALRETPNLTLPPIPIKCLEKV